MLNVLYKSIFAPLGVFNRDNAKGRLQASVVTVLVTVILETVVAPVLYFYVNRDKYEIILDIDSTLIGLAVSIITWLAVCALFWLAAKAFNKGLGFRQVVSV